MIEAISMAETMGGGMCMSHTLALPRVDYYGEGAGVAGNSVQ